MERFTVFFSSLLFFLILTSGLFGQILFEENFDFPAGDTLSHHGWAQIRNGDPIMVHETGLEYDGYSLSAVGNAAQLLASGGQEVKSTFTAQARDSIYISFLINVSEATTNVSGGLFLYLTPADGNIFSPRFTVYTKKNEAGGLAFGITKGGGIRYTDYIYDLNTTYLLVMKYKFDPDGDDTISLWINPNLALAEQAPDATKTGGTDLPEISEIILSQLNASNEPPDALIDGIRIGTFWEDITVAINDQELKPINTFSLFQNYPNPFNPSTIISYKIPQAAFVTLRVYDVHGREVQTLVSDFQKASNYSIVFNATALSAGVYFYQLTAGGYSDCKRMLLLK